VAWLQTLGQQPEWEASIARVHGSEFQQHVGEIGAEIMGLYGTLFKESKWGNEKYSIARESLLGIGATIAAGTSEVQRNAIAMRGFGMPKSY